MRIEDEKPFLAIENYRKTNKLNPNFAYGYVAQVVEIEVDLETGYLRIVNVISANDVGKGFTKQPMLKDLIHDGRRSVRHKNKLDFFNIFFNNF